MMGDPWSITTPLQVALACTKPFTRGERQQALWSESLNVIVGLAGTGTVQIRDREHRVEVGDVVVVPWAAPVIYTGISVDCWTLASIHLVPWYSANIPPEPRHSRADGIDIPNPSRDALPPYPSQVVHPEESLHVTDLALAAIEAWSDTTHSVGWRTWRLRGLAACLLTALEPGSTPDSRVRDLLSWLRRAFRLPIDRETMCRHAGMGSTALGRAVRAATGQSPTAWLIGIRLEEARRLLLTTRMEVADVAKAVGLPDRSHFSRLYRRRFGHPPSQSAKKHA